MRLRARYGERVLEITEVERFEDGKRIFSGTIDGREWSRSTDVETLKFVLGGFLLIPADLRADVAWQEVP